MSVYGFVESVSHLRNKRRIAHEIAVDRAVEIPLDLIAHGPSHSSEIIDRLEFVNDLVGWLAIQRATMDYGIESAQFIDARFAWVGNPEGRVPKYFVKDKDGQSKVAPVPAIGKDWSEL